MKDFDPRKESEKIDFNYDDYWKEKDKDKIEKELKELSKGKPRSGIKGKYIKVKGYVSKNKIKRSYSSYFK